MSVVTASYANSAVDDTVQKGMEWVGGKQEEVARQEGLYIPYKYLNYADKTQDPIASYGKKSKARLQAVSRKYDPQRFFPTSLSTGFKLFR